MEGSGENVSVLSENTDSNYVNQLTEPEIQISYAETEPSICGVCGLLCGNLNEYQNHMRVHIKKTHDCPVCKKVFRRHDHMRRHLLTVHSQDLQAICPMCEKDCEKQINLLEHMKNCRPTDNNYHCRKCGYVADTLTSLQAHETCHVLSTKHECKECNASYKRRDHLIRHIKSRHLMEVVYCEICKQIFKRRDHMLRHIREKHSTMFKDGILVNDNKNEG